MTQQPALVFVDYETNQLTPQGGHLLEVAALLTDTGLNPLTDQGFHEVVYYSVEDTQAMRAGADPRVQEMHDASGLWDRLPHGKPLAEVEQLMLQFIQAHVPEHRMGYLAGSSIRFDHNWMEVHMPSVYEHLHYRSIDVTTLRTVCEWWGIPYRDPFEGGEAPHRADKDIAGSLMIARSVRDSLTKLYKD